MSAATATTVQPQCRCALKPDITDIAVRGALARYHFRLHPLPPVQPALEWYLPGRHHKSAPSKRGRCVHCGRDARYSLGRTVWVEREPELLEDGHESARSWAARMGKDGDPYMKVRYCLACYDHYLVKEEPY